MKRTIITCIPIGISILAGLLLLGCSKNKHPEVIVTGASTIYPIIQMMSEEFGASLKLSIVAQGGGSTRGFEDCVQGRSDLGAMARELSEAEASEVEVFPIALDGVGIVVHADNPIRKITTAQLHRIYRKEIDQWSDLGGKSEEIFVVNKAEGHATLQVFLEHTGLTREELKVDAVAGDNAQVIRIVASSKNAIGYVSLGEVIHSKEIGIPLRLLELDGIEANLSNVASGTYPIFRRLYLISKGQPTAGSREIIDFLSTPPGIKIIERCQYVPIP